MSKISKLNEKSLVSQNWSPRGYDVDFSELHKLKWYTKIRYSTTSLIFSSISGRRTTFHYFSTLEDMKRDFGNFWVLGVVDDTYRKQTCFIIYYYSDEEERENCNESAECVGCKWAKRCRKAKRNKRFRELNISKKGEIDV